MDCSFRSWNSPRDLPDPGIEPGSPALQVDSLPYEPPGKSQQPSHKVWNFLCRSENGDAGSFKELWDIWSEPSTGLPRYGDLGISTATRLGGQITIREAHLAGYNCSSTIIQKTSVMAQKTAPTGQHWKSTDNDRNPLKKYSSSPSTCTSLFFKIALYYLNPGQRLTEFCQENTRVIENTLFQQHKRRLYTWTSPDSQHRNQIDYILCSQRWRSSIHSAKTRPGADCGSDHELLVA